jgi:hypothetical protein
VLGLIDKITIPGVQPYRVAFAISLRWHGMGERLREQKSRRREQKSGLESAAQQQLNSLNW